MLLDSLVKPPALRTLRPDLRGTRRLINLLNCSTAAFTIHKTQWVQLSKRSKMSLKLVEKKASEQKTQLLYRPEGDNFLISEPPNDLHVSFSVVSPASQKLKKIWIPTQGSRLHYLFVFFRKLNGNGGEKQSRSPLGLHFCWRLSKWSFKCVCVWTWVCVWICVCLRSCVL